MSFKFYSTELKFYIIKDLLDKKKREKDNRK